jgi:putative RNA 2'-phosphotransferase
VKLTTKSKFLSLVLRHNPGKIGIELDEYGWANVQELCTKMPIELDILKSIVETDNKKRYSFNDDYTMIKANQGHSVKILNDMDEKEPPEILWHGTAEKNIDSILAHGLGPRSRLHVHLSQDKDTAIKVGTRHGKPVLFQIQSGKMYKDGIIFWLSKNGVWLTDYVSAEYLEKIDL